MEGPLTSCRLIEKEPVVGMGFLIRLLHQHRPQDLPPTSGHQAEFSAAGVPGYSSHMDRGIGDMSPRARSFMTTWLATTRPASLELDFHQNHKRMSHGFVVAAW